MQAMYEAAGLPPGLLVILRVPVGRLVDAAPPIRHENGMTILPVTETSAAAGRRLLLKEEIYFGHAQTACG